MSFISCELKKINIKKLMELKADDFAKISVNDIDQKSVVSIYDKSVDTIDDKSVYIFKKSYNEKSIDAIEKAHDELKKQIFLQIHCMTTCERKNSFNTREFGWINHDVYFFIQRCDRKIMIEFFEEKLFNVSQWDDENQYPIISW
jgi:hypothetical protein